MKDVSPPPGLPPDQHPIWADTVTRLQALHLLDRADANHLRAYVAAVHQHRQATALIDQTGPMIITGTPPNERPAPNPALPVAEKAERRVAHLARTLLLTGRAAPGAAMTGAPAMRERPGGGRWCEAHKRWECTADRSRGRGPCHGIAARGIDKCRMHMRAKKGKHLVAVAQHDFPLAVEPVDIHPAEALLWRVKYLTAFLKAIDAEVARIGREEATWGLERREDSELGERVVHGARLSPWLELQDRTGRALVAAASAALQANAEERLVRMAEAQGARLFAAYQRGLGKLRLSPEQWDLAVAGYAEVLGELVS